MAEQAVCKCGIPYFPQQYLLDDAAKCPACGQELCLATCKCGKLLTIAHRQAESLLVWSSVVDFKCPDCGDEMAVKLESRRNRRVIVMFLAILFGAMWFGIAWWQGSSVELALLAGFAGAMMVVVAFYFK